MPWAWVLIIIYQCIPTAYYVLLNGISNRIVGEVADEGSNRRRISSMASSMAIARKQVR